MKLNGVEYYQGMGDKHKYPAPKLSTGQVIEFLYDVEDKPLSGCGPYPKKGKYKILHVGPGVTPNISYTIKRIGSNIKKTNGWGVYFNRQSN